MQDSCISCDTFILVIIWGMIASRDFFEGHSYMLALLIPQISILCSLIFHKKQVKKYSTKILLYLEIWEIEIRFLLINGVQKIFFEENFQKWNEKGSW